MDYLSAASTALYYVAYPIFYILNVVLLVFTIITAPLLHLGQFCLYACYTLLCVLGKLETLYIFFGTAALVGIITGTSLHYVSGFIMSMLDSDSLPEERRGRTLAAYRAEKQERRVAKDPTIGLVQKDEALQKNEHRLRDDPMNWNKSKQDRGGGGKFNTILEEEDTSDGF